MNARSLLIQLMLMTMVATAALVAYHRFVHVPSLRYGVVDVAEIYRQKERELVERVSKADLSEAEKKAATDSVLEFGKRMQVALGELSQDCGCLVLARHAVAADTPNTIDLTPLLRSKVGM